MDPCLGDLILVLKLPRWFKRLLSFLLKPLVRVTGMQGHSLWDPILWYLVVSGSSSLPPLVCRSGQAWPPHLFYPDCSTFHSLTNLFVKTFWAWEVREHGGSGLGHQSLTLCLFWCSFLGWQSFSTVCVLGENFSCTLMPAPAVSSSAGLV